MLIKKNEKSVLITGGRICWVSTTPIFKFRLQSTVLYLHLWKYHFPHPNLKILKGDIRDKELLKKNLEDIDTVIHLACISNDSSFGANQI